ncbi:hypothetical protein J3A64_004688 [Pseudarthrobacter sp. PvP004]|nr:hypothetical protein [Pseudarthrobacter sp. PvP004]MBP2269148.1 hypothetical protein [Pseudarthrobacter sp. PvP004]
MAKLTASCYVPSPRVLGPEVATQLVRGAYAHKGLGRLIFREVQVLE